MDTSKIYQDSEGNNCSIWQMVRREPDWAANRVQEGEVAAERLADALQVLRDIAFPLEYLQRKAEAEGGKLSGMAYSIANTPETLKEMARTALARLEA